MLICSFAALLLCRVARLPFCRFAALLLCSFARLLWFGFGGGDSRVKVLDHFVNFARGVVIGILSRIAAAGVLLDKRF